MKVVRALSKIYTSVYYVNVLNDTFVEVHSLFEVRDHIGETGHAQDRLNYFARNKGNEPQLLQANSHCGNDGERICRRRARGKNRGHERARCQTVGFEHPCKSAEKVLAVKKTCKVA